MLDLMPQVKSSQTALSGPSLFGHDDDCTHTVLMKKAGQKLHDRTSRVFCDSNLHFGADELELT